ncbi:transporter substrate-binding domain-containing protein [Streptomyces sp. G44]|uniref:transporter substrate-binding domain-containing protein n=1 Tax=Streptomyces sp. G44 TaxID=2807632 RepID=UPI001960CBDF|nr:transporter substrate-binding domain-containing protein [Streptomyces sp. G44]MBM7170262.1 transporter substrate-binding domain-containing protein [Streptomyces sp. G44]
MLAVLTACTGSGDDGADGQGATPAPGPTPVVQPGARVNVGVLGDLPGWSRLDTGSNTLQGFQADLMYWLEDELEIDVTPVQVTFEQRINYMKNGKADIMLANVAMNDERREYVDFAGPYVYSEQEVMTAKGGPDIGKVKDLGGKTVCTMRGTTSLQQLNEKLAVKMTIVERAGLSQCVSDLKRGDVDAVFTAQVDLLGYAQEDEHLRLENIQVGTQDRFGIAVPNGDRESCERLTRALKTFIAKGYWDQYFREHFPDEDIATHKPTPNDLAPCE